MQSNGNEDERGLRRRQRSWVANIASLVLFLLIVVGQAFNLYSGLIAGFLVATAGGARGALFLMDH